MEPLVSVICITRNHERFCIESLDSVLNQTFKNIEIIILDAASTDNTVKLIDNWLILKNINVVFLKEKELKPITVNLNKALTYSKGKYVQFLSLDDLLLTGKIENQIDYLQSNSSCGMVFSDAVIIDENSQIKNDVYCGLNDIKFELYGNREFYRLFRESPRIIAPTTLYKKKIFSDIGLFDEDLTIEDWDIYLRIAKSNWEIKYQYQKTTAYRIVESSLSRSTEINFQINILKTYLKHNIFSKRIIFSFFEKNEQRCLKERLILFKYALKSQNKSWKIFGLLYTLGINSKCLIK